jgi:pyridoxal phosphate enzyme (YggS family)
VVSPTVTSSIADNLAAVRARIARAVAGCGRPPDSVRLVAVSKTFGVDAIRAAIAAGQRDFGENKVQEALPKIDALAAEDVVWHLIGHLQSNKARKAARPFDVIHSIDSLDLARKVDAAGADGHRRPRLLVQLDLAGEVTKHGATLDEARRLFDAAGSFTSAAIVGLMAIPPWLADPEAVRPYFRRLRESRDLLASEGVGADQLRELSMGMSHDFEVAIEEGATMVRVGTAIFGRRTPPAATP